MTLEAFPDTSRPQFDVSISGIKRALTKARAGHVKETAKESAGRLLKAVARLLKKLEDNVVQQMLHVMTKSGKVVESFKENLKIENFEDVVLHVALHGVSHIQNQFQYERMLTAVQATGASTVVRVATVLTKEVGGTAVELLGRANIKCTRPADQTSKAHHNACLAGWVAGVHPTVDVRIQGFKTASMHLTAANKTVLKLAIVTALSKIKTHMKNVSEALLGKGSATSELSKVMKESVEGARDVHVSMRIHGMSKVGNRDDLETLFQAIDEAAEKASMLVHDSPSVDIRIVGFTGAKKAAGSSGEAKVVMAVLGALRKTADAVKASAGAAMKGDGKGVVQALDVSVPGAAGVKIHFRIMGVSKVRTPDDLKAVESALEKSVGQATRAVSKPSSHPEVDLKVKGVSAARSAAMKKGGEMAVKEFESAVQAVVRRVAADMLSKAQVVFDGRTGSSKETTAALQAMQKGLTETLAAYPGVDVRAKLVGVKNLKTAADLDFFKMVLSKAVEGAVKLVRGTVEVKGDKGTRRRLLMRIAGQR